MTRPQNDEGRPSSAHPPASLTRRPKHTAERTEAKQAVHLAHALELYRGQRFLGVIDGVGCIEFVFSGSDENLLSIWPDRRTYARGYVSDPESYAAECRVAVPTRELVHKLRAA